MAAPVPVNEPLLDGNEKRYLAECIDSGWISSDGPFVRRFEEQFAARVGRRHAIAVANGSVALDLAVFALKLGSGDEVIVPSGTIISCLAAIVRAGATPVLVDTDPVTWSMDARQIEARITPKTKAVMAVHTYGLPVDMDHLLEVARRHGLRVIEDAAEMIGQTCSGKPCGSFGEVSAFSFYANKVVTSGEGGMVVTDDPALAERCRSGRNLCFQARRFVHEELGYNFRMTNLQAAVGLAQLERLDEFVARKVAMGGYYDALLAGVRGLQLPTPRVAFADNHYWVYGVVLDDAMTLDAQAAMARLAKEGVATRPFFWCMHEQPVFAKRNLFEGERYPVAERLARRGFYLPSGLALSQAQMERVAATLRRILE